jgi:hypothetical protein
VSEVPGSTPKIRIGVVYQNPGGLRPGGGREEKIEPRSHEGHEAVIRRLVPSPLYSGERVRVRGLFCSSGRKAKPLTPALSPEYKGEGVDPGRAN